MAINDEERVIAGRYRLITRVGGGGMGEVWRAYDERLHRTVAVKRLHLPADLTDEQAEAVRRRTMREGRVAARLQHRHSITVFDVIEDDGRPYLVMEYLDSTNLAGVLDQRGSLPPVEVARLGAQAASALAAAHDVGVVHRDVKPGNILLADDGTVKITDFGVSRVVEDVAGTTTRGVAGTPAYLAPEVGQGKKASYASDVFSLGATLYTAVEGKPPYEADNVMKVLFRVASGDIDPPTRAGPMTDVLVRMMAPDPQHRPDMAQARDALAAIVTAAEDDPDAAVAGALPFGAGAAADPATEEGAAAPTERVEPAGDQARAEQQPESPTRETELPPLQAAPPVRQAEPPAGRGEPPAGRAEPPVGSSAHHGDPAERKRKHGALLVAGAVLVIALIATVVALNRDDEDPGAAAPGASTTSAEETTSEQAANPPPAPVEPPGSAEPPATSAEPRPTTTTTPSEEPPADPQPPASPTPQGTLADYYALMPGDLDAGWAKLTPKYRRSPAGGEGGYRAFWGRINSVAVSGISASGSTVEATVDYSFKDGRQVRERHRYLLVREGSAWKIDESTVLSSSPR